MNYKIVLNFFLLFILSANISFAQKLSEASIISLLTCAPGDEIYSVYGHNAIRIYDPEHQIDKVYNYGTFDFEESGFMLKFLRGKLRYQLTSSSFIHFMREYNYLERDVTEGQFNLSPNQKQHVFDLLEINLLPEHKYYMYDFFYDNCATRIRDILEKVIGTNLSYSSKSEQLTLRNMLDNYTYRDQWLTFGQSLIVGANADKQADIRQQMFIPDYLNEHFKKATQKSLNNDQLIIKNEKSLIHFNKKYPITIFTPVMLFLLILVWEIYLLLKAKKISWIKYYDKTIHYIMGIASFVIIIMWFLTDHGATKDNWNLLWINPLFWLLIFGRKLKKMTLYTIFGLAFFLLLSLFYKFLPQDFYPGVAILIVALTVNVFRQWSELKSNIAN